MPENWVQHPVVNTEEGTNPGAPLAWGSPENPDDVVAGYGYVAADTSEVEETFYYHSDHLGSTSYITDQQANVTQYDAYLPYGELLVDEHSSSADLPYKFNGKELDEETGLYYYGARYMNSLTSMWYGVDPLTEQYVNIGAYIYCHSNPIVLIDPDGQGDYYKQNGTWGKTDKRDDNLAYVENNKGSYVLLPYTNDVLLGFASLIDKESSGNIDESMAIGSAVMNFLSRGGSKQLKTLEDVAMYENHYSYGAKKEVYQKFCKLSHTKQNAKGGIRSAINAICFYENVEGVESKNYAVFNGVKADCWDGMDLVLKNGNPHTRKYIWSADSKRIIEKYISKVEGSNPNLKFKYSNKGSQGASSSAIGIVGFTVFQKLLSGHGEGKKTDKKTGRLLPVAESNLDISLIYVYL